jgi:hypothetical protein
MVVCLAHVGLEVKVAGASRPWTCFFHGRDARAWGLAISLKPLSRNTLFGFILLNP